MWIRTLKGNKGKILIFPYAKKNVEKISIKILGTYLSYDKGKTVNKNHL